MAQNFNPDLFQFENSEYYPWLIFPKTTLAIVTWNRLEYTKKLLDSLLRYTHLPHEFLIVDNASTDGTVEFLQAFAFGERDVRLKLNRKNVGLGRAHLQIRDAVQDGLVVIFDNDAEILSNYWLLHVQKAFYALHLATGSVNAALGIRLVNCEEYGFRFAPLKETLTIPHAKNAPPRTSFAAASKDDGDAAVLLDEQVVLGWTDHLLGPAFALPAELLAKVPYQDKYPKYIGGTDTFFSDSVNALGARLGYIENGPIARHNDWPYTEEKIAKYEELMKKRAPVDANFVRWKLRDLVGRFRR